MVFAWRVYQTAASGIRRNYGVSFSSFDFVTWFAVPKIHEVLSDATSLVVISHRSDCIPCDMTMDTATGDAIVGLLLPRCTVTCPGPASHSSFAVPITLVPPTTGNAESDRDRIPIGRTMS